MLLLPHLLGLPWEPESLAFALCSQVLGEVPGLAALGAGSPRSVIKMHRPPDTVVDWEGDSSLKWAAVEAAQMFCSTLIQPNVLVKGSVPEMFHT